MARTHYFGKYLPGLFNFFDLVLVNIIFALTIVLYPEIAQSSRINMIWVLVNTSYLPVVLWTMRSTHSQRILLMDHVFLGAVETVGIHALFFLSLLTFVNLDVIPWRAFVTFYSLMAIFVPLWWIVSRQILKAMRRAGYNYVRAVIVGSGSTARRLLEEMQSDAGFGIRVLGFFSDNPDPSMTCPHLGSIADIGTYVKRMRIDHLYYTMQGDGEYADTLSSVVKTADDNVISFYYVPRISRRIARSFELHNIGAMPVVSIRHNPLTSTVNRAIKRAFDIAFSATVLIFSPLVFIPVAIAIKLSSPGPIFFSQERTGYRGNTFRCYKFRTMRVNAAADSHQATRHDPRTTAVGQLLRRTSIDELPQFFNVLRGDMSIVGPRPHMLSHTDQYAKLIDFYMVRHLVKPGITGWAQVNGYRGITDELWKMERRVEFDCWYIENWSFLLDMKIIVRTVINAIAGEKNAF